MAPAASKMSNTNAFIGFGCSLGFLLFVSKFNDAVQTYKTKMKMKKGRQQKMDPSLYVVLAEIFKKSCGWREVYTFFSLATCLLLRTFGSVWVSRQWGNIVSTIVQRKWARMKVLVLQFAGATVGLAFLNAFLKYYIAMLKENVRERITTWVHAKYMRPKDMIFYKANKVGDDKIENCDHQITSDVDKFSELFATVMSQSLKPVVDFVVYSVELSRVQGLTTPLTLYGWFAFASCLSTVTLPPFGELAAQEQKLEGKFRGAHSELITNCEQIAFLGGEEPEMNVLNQQYERLRDHCRKGINLAFNSEVFRQYLNKYFVSVIGLFLVSRPIRLGLNGYDSLTPDQISAYFVSTWRNMEAMSTSIQDLFELTNRIGKLSGLATRVKGLMVGIETRNPILVDEIEKAKKGPHPPKFVKGDNLKFEHVSVYKPDGTLLVKDLNFEVERGSRYLITGPNGCGKSSLFRVIRKLWPLVSGTITMPDDEEIYFLTQVNFVPLGSLRDLVIYPHSMKKMKQRGITDEHIYDVLDWACCSPKVLEGRTKADLEFTVEGKVVRPKLDDIRDWQKDLSPGQKQKLAFARLFYHNPKFVVLDECTNGISPDVENALYSRCTMLNMAIFSISHKVELKDFHDFELHYYGDSKGSYQLLPCSETRGKIL